LEQRDQDILVDLGTEIADEDGILGATIVASIGKATARSPIQLERTARVGHRLAAELEGLGSGIRGGEINEAIAGVT